MLFKKKIQDRLVFWHERNIKLLYVVNFLRNSKFYEGIWIFYWLKFMSFGQLGLFQTIAFAFGLLVEIPAGAMCDLIGRKKTAILSSFFPTIGALIIAFANSANAVLIGFMFVHLGWSMYEGSIDGLAYESLQKTGNSKIYDKIVSVNSILSTLSSNISIALGGVLYLINFRLPYLFWALFYFLAFISTFFYQETFKREKFSFTNYLTQVYQGFLQLISPHMRAYFVVILALRAMIYMYQMGMLKPSIALGFGFNEKSQSFLFAITGILTIPIVYLIPKLRTKISDKKGLYMITLLLGVSFILSSLPVGHFGAIILLLFNICGSLAFPWVSVVINNHVPSKYRATTLATNNLLMKLPYVLSALFIGRIIENNKLPYFNFNLGLVIILSVFLSIYIFYLTKQKYKYNFKYRFSESLIYLKSKVPYRKES